MHISIKHIILLAVCTFLLFDKSMEAQTLITEVNGNWNYTIASNDLLEAGNDFSGTYTSNSNQVQIDIYKSGGNRQNRNFYNWTVSIEKSDISWNNSLIIYAQRTGDGTKYLNRPNYNPTITGGNNYIQISDIPQTFFSGSLSILDIPVQYQITGASVLIPADTYSTTIIYTVTSP